MMDEAETAATRKRLIQIRDELNHFIESGQYASFMKKMRESFSINAWVRNRVLEEMETEKYVVDADETYEEWEKNLIISKTIRLTKEQIKEIIEDKDKRLAVIYGRENLSRREKEYQRMWKEFWEREL